MHPRYALYWAPPAGSRLWTLCSAILGRDAETGQRVTQPDLPGFSPERLAELTAAPRRYGPHATLKAPFRLAEGRTLRGLEDAVQAFAAERAVFALPGLAVAQVGHFLALRTTAPCEALGALAFDCVELFDDFRAPASPEELAKRRAKKLSRRQEELLERYGYPYVAEEYRFHLTLSNSIADDNEREKLQHALESLLSERVSRELEHVTLSEISLFLQPGDNEPFSLYRRFPFGG